MLKRKNKNKKISRRGWVARRGGGGGGTPIGNVC